ncbi:MAG: methyltransferase family protein [Candidatus Heimdallarchaeota archaeon]
MSLKRHNGQVREFPHTHIYHALLPVIFISFWVIDSQLFHLSTILNSFVPFYIRIILAASIFIIALILILLSHRTLFKSHQPPNILIKNGILAYVRNPMYLGILLIYIAFISFSISIICIGLFCFVFLIYNKMVNFEEKILENMFDEEYLNYKKKVSKWIPNPFKK